MISTATLAEFVQRGIQFRINGEQLVIRAPKDSLTFLEREKLSQDKAEIIATLREHSSESVTFCPLSNGQRALWFLYQFAPQSPAYNLTTAMRIASQVDVHVLRRILQALIIRHPCLRTTYSVLSGTPVQLVHDSVEVHFEVIEASLLTRKDLNDQIANEADRPFDLEHGPVLRANLFTRSDGDHVLQITVHHIAYDFWSGEIFVHELRELYTSEKLGRTPTLMPLNLQYPDYVRWQSEVLASAKGEKLWAYWKHQLAQDIPILRLPSDKPRPLLQTFRGTSYSFNLEGAIIEGLKAIAKAQGATLYMTLLAAFFVLLHRYSSLERLVIGSPTAGRSRAEFEGIVGFFVNPIILLGDLSGNPDFRALLGQVRRTVLGAIEHADYPFPLLVEKLRPSRDMNYSPLFQVSFVWDKLRIQDGQKEAAPGPNVAPSEENEKRLVLEPIMAGQRGADCDLDLIIIEHEGSLSASWRYNVDLFDAASIVRMTSHFQTLLGSIVANPEERILELSLLPDEERRLLLTKWNGIQSDHGRDKCAHELFEAWVEEKPNSPAVTFEGKTMSYLEVNERANKIAHYLRENGVGPETLVGIYMERSLDLITSVLGVLKAGGAYLPLDMAYPRERLAFMLEDSRTQLVLTHGSFPNDLSAHHAKVLDLTIDRESIERQDCRNPYHMATPENLVYVIYTSGSTGRAKGVMVTHSSLTNAYFGWEESYRLRTIRSHLQMASFSFDVFSGDLVRALCSGGKLVLCPRDYLMDPERLYDLMYRERVECAEFVPAVLRELVLYLEANKKLLDFVRVLICGSDSWYMEEYSRFKRLCGSETRLINSYGVTEATIDSSYFEGMGSDFAPDRLVPIGRPFADVQLYILDNNLQPTPIGVPGELYIGGAGLARGYLNRPELTTEKFIPDPFCIKPDARLYKTGDLSRYRSDGNIELLGRMDLQVKIRGFRVEIGEIESVLSQHPAVRQNAVTTMEEASGSNRILAYVTINGQPGPSTSDLRSFLKEKLPDYMVPSAFIIMDELPLMPNGKVDRKGLPKPDKMHTVGQEFVAPRSETEIRVANIWQEMLKMERVGINDDFFELGGHSLLLTKIMSRINGMFGTQLSLRRFFEVRTVEGLAEMIDTLIWASGRVVQGSQTEEREIIQL